MAEELSEKRRSASQQPVASPSPSNIELDLQSEEFDDEMPIKRKGKTRSIRPEHEHEEEDLEWDITPMVDVAFLLLIFFMLTASFSIQKVIRTSVPQSDKPSANTVQVQQKDKFEQIIIQVDEFNSYTVISSDGESQQASSKQELITILRDLRYQFGDQPAKVVIQAHVDSMHGATVGCLDAARAAEFNSFQLVAVEDFDL